VLPSCSASLDCLYLVVFPFPKCLNDCGFYGNVFVYLKIPPTALKSWTSKIRAATFIFYTCFLTLRGHRMRVLEKGVRRRIFGHKRDEVTGWRKLHNKSFKIVLFLRPKHRWNDNVITNLWK
jgi:hypothetical protein